MSFRKDKMISGRYTYLCIVSSLQDISPDQFEKHTHPLRAEQYIYPHSLINFEHWGIYVTP